MKKTILLFLLLTSALARASDCTHCLTDLSWLFPFLEWPIQYIEIEKVDYERNENATFCKRPEEMVDTIVLHHSETHSTDTPERLNDYHLARGSANDPWLMIGYSYVINSPYDGASLPVARVTEGRPLDIVGAHAGSNVFAPMDTAQKKLWDEGKIICGNEKLGFKPDPSLIKNGKIKANVTTLGLAVTGNYSPFSRDNPNGYPRNAPRHPTKKTLDMIARTSCQLQKKYPRMKNIKWHHYYHPTSCPGNILGHIGQIKELARKYGCEFN